MNTAPSFEHRYFSGAELYGDDFDEQQIAHWFADEEHGYADLHGTDPRRHDYGYTALNVHHGYSALPATRRFRHALGFGSNVGDELVPVLDRIERITLLDASDRYVVNQLRGVPVNYVLAHPSGSIALDRASVDLITCFGVLHHIPNVSRVLAEFSRVLAPGGWLLMREPTTTMGDWRRPRRGLTVRERGIPRRLFVSMVERAGLEVNRAADCYFPPWVRLCSRLGVATFRSPVATAMDSALARASAWNYTYHRPGIRAKFAPASLFVAATKP
ncbi:MAG: class I SAM-dependent methyltransferase [Methylibium sp.]|nr:class I SAM-dependent methyltransferase [Methylibium sp.]